MKERLGQQSTVEISLADAGFMWTAPVLMGASLTQLQLVFDLGSDWLTAQALGCSNCQGDVFDTTKGMQTSAVTESHLYGSANLTGRTYRDQVCLTNNAASCVQNFEYFAVFEQTGLRPPIEGILGLCQNKQFMFSDTPRKVGPLFIQELQKAGKIKS